MKFWVCLLLAVITKTSEAQLSTVGYINSYYSTNSDAIAIDALAYKLTAPYTTDKERVKSIFKWITDNISYKVPKFQGRLTAGSKKRLLDDMDSGELKPLNERVAEIVLRDKEAFCDGYARLFKTLCDYAGIKSEIVSGYAKGDSRANFNFKSNHSWNAVFFDSSWHLLDATWAAGHFTYSSPEFVHQYNDRYFLTQPQVFLQDHYPEDVQWTLLPTDVSISDFNRSPFHYGTFSKFKILSYLPTKGIIDASLGDTLQFEMQTEEIPKTYWVSDTTFVDTFYTPGEMGVKPIFNIDGNKVRCTYAVASEATQWLQVVFNDRIIMRYKLNVRKNSAIANLSAGY